MRAAPKSPASKTDSRPSPDGYSYFELRSLASAAIEAGLSVLLRGSPGVGKSTLARELAAVRQLPLHDIRLAQREPAELCGVHFPDRDRQALVLLPPDWVRAVCDAPGFVFLDEINAAVTRLHQAAAYQIVLERRVGPYRFHPGTVVFAAGNLDDDGALVSPLSSALNNRFVHLRMRVDAPAWLRWAEAERLHPAILGYIGSRGTLGADTLYSPSDDDAFPTPRSWEMASRLLAFATPGDGRRLVAACVGLSAAEKFYAYFKIHRRFDPKAVVERGKPVDFADAEPSFAYAAIHVVADYLVQSPLLSDKHLGHIARFVATDGLDPELRMVFLRRLRAAGTLLTRLAAIPEYRAVASDLVDLQLEATASTAGLA
jgi:hypothetical protein